jgi:hypothetical protein
MKSSKSNNRIPIATKIFSEASRYDMSANMKLQEDIENVDKFPVFYNTVAVRPTIPSIMEVAKFVVSLRLYSSANSI